MKGSLVEPEVTGMTWKFGLQRIRNRLKYVFLRWCIPFKWPYEACNDCGHCLLLAWSIKDELWVRVMGTDGGCLCLSCFIERAMLMGIEVKAEDLKWLCIFAPEQYMNDIIKEKEPTND